jgi:hypothetical protein
LTAQCTHSSTCYAELRIAPINRAERPFDDLLRRAQTRTT